MTQQDLTAPIDKVKVSRRELFSRAYEMLQDETTPQDLAGYFFTAELASSRGRILELSEGSGIARPLANQVAVTLNTIQMGELTPGAYSLYLFGTRHNEREMFVQIAMQVDP